MRGAASQKANNMLLRIFSVPNHYVLSVHIFFTMCLL